MESLTWNKTDTDAVYAYMQEQERPAYMDTVRSVTAENGVPYLRFPMLESESFIEHGFSTRKKSKKHKSHRNVLHNGGWGNASALSVIV